MARKVKVICIKRFLWKRVAREFSRLGWYITNAEEETTTTYTHHYDVYDDGTEVYTGTSSSSKVAIWLTMARDRDWYVNGFKIIPIDIFFTIFFYLRRLLGVILPVTGIIFLVVLLLGAYQQDSPFTIIFLANLFSWIGLNLLEIIFSFIGGAILKKGEEKR